MHGARKPSASGAVAGLERAKSAVGRVKFLAPASVENTKMVSSRDRLFSISIIEPT
jgi:hypothetical protein